MWRWMILFLWVFKVMIAVPMPWIGSPLAMPPRRHVDGGVVKVEMKKSVE